MALKFDIKGYNNIFIFFYAKGTYLAATSGLYGTGFTYLRPLKRNVFYFQDIFFDLNIWKRIDGQDFRYRG